MKTTIAIVAGAAIVNGILPTHDVCKDTLQEHTLCTNGGVCDCDEVIEQNGCGNMFEETHKVQYNSETCERSQLVTDLIRIAANEGNKEMQEACWAVKESIEDDGAPPSDRRVSCGCIGRIPQDEMPGALNCILPSTNNFHGYVAYNVCTTIVSALNGRRRAEDAETKRRMSLTVDEAYNEIQSDPELKLLFEATQQRERLERRRQSFEKDATWKNVLTSGAKDHSGTLQSGEMWEATQSGVCNNACGLCEASANFEDDDDVDMTEEELNKFGLTKEEWQELPKSERKAIKKEFKKNESEGRRRQETATVEYAAGKTCSYTEDKFAVQCTGWLLWKKCGFGDTEENFTLEQCAAACVSRDDCVVWNYKPNRQKCYLYKGDPEKYTVEDSDGATPSDEEYSVSGWKTACAMRRRMPTSSPLGALMTEIEG